MTEDFPNLVKEINMQIQEAHRVTNKVNPRVPYQDTSELKCKWLKTKRES